MRITRLSGLTPTILWLAALVAAAGCSRLQVQARTTSVAHPSGESARPRLRGPFDVAATRALSGRPLPPPEAPGPTTPIRDLNGTSFYRDERHSIADPE